MDRSVSRNTISELHNVTNEDRARGIIMHNLAQRIWDFPRSITGDGVRKTLHVLQEVCPELEIIEIPSGYKVFDWKVPEEWNLIRARLYSPDGEILLDTDENLLHIVGYSIPTQQEIELEELQEHLYSIPDMPDAIPYVTSYYERRWGFSMAHRMRESLVPGIYKVHIETTLAPGSLSIGEVVLKGDSKKEIFLSTYVCHPSMANNELSGPVVAAELIKYISDLPRRRYTYRIVFIPETIGSISYLSKNLRKLKRRVIAGFNLTCMGDDRSYSMMPSRDGNTLSDSVAKHSLRWLAPDFKMHSWLDRGSDERQYCAPGIDLPVVSIMRTKYWDYPEYHTSLDNLTDVVTPNGLAGGFAALRDALMMIEMNVIPRVTILCEPQLGRRGLYSTIGAGRFSVGPRLLLDVISYSDGSKSCLEIADILNRSFSEVREAIELLKSEGLIKTRES